MNQEGFPKNTNSHNANTYGQNLKAIKQVISKINDRTILAALQERRPANEKGNNDLIFFNPVALKETENGYWVADKIPEPIQPFIFQDAVREYFDLCGENDINILTMLGGTMVFLAENMKLYSFYINTHESKQFLEDNLQKALDMITERDAESGTLLDSLSQIIKSSFSLGLIRFDGTWDDETIFHFNQYDRINRCQIIQNAEHTSRSPEEEKNKATGDKIYEIIKKLHTLYQQQEQKGKYCLILEYWLLQFFLINPDFVYNALRESDLPNATKIFDLGIKLAYTVSTMEETVSLISGEILQHPLTNDNTDRCNQYNKLLPQCRRYSAFAIWAFLERPHILAQKLLEVFTTTNDPFDRLVKLCDVLEEFLPYFHVPNPMPEHSAVLNAFDRLLTQTEKFMQQYGTAVSALEKFMKDIEMSRKIFQTSLGIDMCMLPICRGIEVLFRETLFILRKINKETGQKCTAKDKRNLKFINALYSVENRNANAVNITFGYKLNGILDAQDPSDDYYHISKIIQDVDSDLTCLREIHARLNDTSVLGAKLSDLRNTIAHNLDEEETAPIDIHALNSEILSHLLDWLNQVPGLIASLCELNQKLHHHPVLNSKT